jgi:predicted DNA binding protein
MALTAEFQLRHSELPLVDVATDVPDLTFELIDHEQTRSGLVAYIIRANGQSFDGLRTALQDASYVSEHTLISDIESTQIYQVVMEELPPVELDELSLSKIFVEQLTITADGWYIRQQFATQDEFDAYREFFRENDGSFHLQRLYDSTSTDAELIGLSDKQREALLAAYREGYFDVPQRASLDDVAATLDISRSAFAERLRRAQSHLIEHFYHTDLY